MSIDTVRPYAIVQVDGPQTAIDTAKADALLTLEVTEAPTAQLRRAQVADARQNPDRAGVRPPLHGVWHDSTCSVKWYEQGTKALAAAGAPAIATAQTHLIASAMQGEPELQTASAAAAGGQTTTVIVDDTGGAHEPASDDSTTPVGLIEVEYPSGSGRCVVRPYLYDADTITKNLLLALPQALSEGDAIYAGIEHSYIREPRDALAQYNITARIYGKQQVQNATLVGCAGIIKAPALGPDGFPVCECELHPASVTLEPSGAAPAESAADPQCLAGGELLLGVVGDTTLYDVWPMRVEWPSYPAGLTKVTKQGGTSGLQLWDRAGEAGQVKIQIPKRITPDDLGLSTSGDGWYSAFAAGELDAVRLQCLDQHGGGVPGSSLTRYAPDLTIVQVEDGGDLDGEESWMLTCSPTIGSDYAPLKILEG